MGKDIYLLWFIPRNEDEADALLIGAYESEPDAQAAITRMKSKPGFIDFPQGFQIHAKELGKDSWQEGFIRTT